MTAADKNPPIGEADLSAIVAANLRRLRVRNGLSLERLAQSSGVSRAMLGQIERGRSVPGLGVLWKLAQALNVPLQAFTEVQRCDRVIVTRSHRALWLRSSVGQTALRQLAGKGDGVRAEFLEVRLMPRAVEDFLPKSPGSQIVLALVRGCLDLSIGDERHVLNSGDSARFPADTPHSFHNSGLVEAVAYLLHVDDVFSA